MKKSVSKEVRRKLRGFINRERGVGREPTISRHQTGERFKKLAHSAYIDPRRLREFLIKNPEWERSPVRKSAIHIFK